MWEGKLNMRREGGSNKNPEEKLWSDRDNIRNRSVSTDSLSFSLTYLPSLPSGSGSDAVRPNYSPPLSFLLHLPTCPPGFIHLLIFQTLPPFFSFPIAPFLPVALDHQHLPQELWISKRLYPGILPTPAQLTASSEPGSVLEKGSSHTKVKLNTVFPKVYMEPFQGRSCILWSDYSCMGTLMEKWGLWFTKCYVAKGNKYVVSFLN